MKSVACALLLVGQVALATGPGGDICAVALNEGPAGLGKLDFRSWGIDQDSLARPTLSPTGDVTAMAVLIDGKHYVRIAQVDTGKFADYGPYADVRAFNFVKNSTTLVATVVKSEKKVFSEANVINYTSLLDKNSADGERHKPGLASLNLPGSDIRGVAVKDVIFSTKLKYTYVTQYSTNTRGKIEAYDPKKPQAINAGTTVLSSSNQMRIGELQYGKTVPVALKLNPDNNFMAMALEDPKLTIYQGPPPPTFGIVDANSPNDLIYQYTFDGSGLEFHYVPEDFKYTGKTEDVDLGQELAMDWIPNSKMLVAAELTTGAYQVVDSGSGQVLLSSLRSGVDRWPLISVAGLRNGNFLLLRQGSQPAGQKPDHALDRKIFVQEMDPRGRARAEVTQFEVKFDDDTYLFPRWDQGLSGAKVFEMGRGSLLAIVLPGQIVVVNHSKPTEQKIFSLFKGLNRLSTQPLILGAVKLNDRTLRIVTPAGVLDVPVSL